MAARGVAAGTVRRVARAFWAATGIAVRRWEILFAIGLVLVAILVWRSQVGGDQLNLLARGWLLASQGVWIPYGNRTSAGGFEPGGLTSVLVGGPLAIWSDRRAPVVLIALLTTAGYLLIDRVLARVHRGRLRIPFAILYWLSPWRLFFSGHLWNPNYLLFFGAVHLATAYASRTGARVLPSLAHGAALTFAPQLHPSAMILVIASALLAWRRRITFHWPALAGGLVLGSSTLVPYLFQAWHDPALLPGQHGFVGRGLLLVFPVLRGVLYWLRYSSLSLGRKLIHFDFSPILGDVLAWPVEIALAGLELILDPLTMVIAIAANLWLLGRWRRGRGAPVRSALSWLRAYSVALFAAGVISFALSPTTVMSWQCVPFMHAAVLPLTLWTALHLRTPWRPVAEAGMRAWLAAAVVFAVAMAFGSPLFRAEGRHPERVPLRDHPMLYEIGLADQSSVRMGGRRGAQADVLTYP